MTLGMDEHLDIREVARRTGITSRALRFYEARGLVLPLRTGSGRRLYDAAALERLNQVLALKRAGLTLAQIQRLSARRPLGLAALVDAQLASLDARAAEIAEARALLLSVKSRIDRGEPVDVATFCSLVRQGDAIMTSGNWKKVVDDHYSATEQAHWAEHAPPAGFDQAEYGRQWQALGARIEAALPLDPAGAEGQALLDEWNALLQPFLAVATPEMKAGAARLYARMDDWKGEQAPPFSAAAWSFIQAAAEARKSQGG
jgi:DNA-binding transcriptional MerR regulator